jgi:F-type H+-transporting ATPase subunit a
LFKNPKNLAIILIVLAVLVGSRFIFPLPELPELSVAAEVLFRLGGEHGFPITNSILMTLLVDVVLLVLALMATARLRRGEGAVPRGLQNIFEYTIESLYNLARSIDRRNVHRFFTFVVTIFFFVLLANWLALVPGVGSIGICRSHANAQIAHVAAPEAHGSEADAATIAREQAEVEKADLGNGTCGTHENEETGRVEADVLVPLFRSPSADLNLTLALALLSFVVTEYFGFKEFGFGYLGKFFNFKEGALMFVVGILEFISEFVRILAFTFRLFGNIFAGEVVLVVMSFLVPWVLPMPFYGFEIFVGFIQAFIFMVLTVAFIGMALTPHHPHEEHGGAHDHDTPEPEHSLGTPSNAAH